MAPISNQGLDDKAAQALVELCAGVLPVWARHLATSRSQSEKAVTEMLQAFSDIGPHINMAERQSQQITEALSQHGDGVTGLTQACERALVPLLENGQLSGAAADAVRSVLSMVSRSVTALENIAKPFHHETLMVAEQVERMYIGFQYQDRISQMMALLEGDIARLQDAVAGEASGIPDVKFWLARLETQYAMSEQRQDHSEGAPQTDGSAGDSNETTFF